MSGDSAGLSLARTADLPLIEIRERDPGRGALPIPATPFDPGGWAWLSIVGGQVVLGWLAARLIRAARRS